MSYAKLSTAFQNKTPYKYSKDLIFDGTKIIATETTWVFVGGRWKIQTNPDKVVLAEYIQHNGKSYAVVYNRGNKCFATEVMAYGYNHSWRRQNLDLKYGEIGKPDKDQQKAYKCQMIDALIYSGVVQYILIPTSLNGDSKFFEIEGV